MSVATENRKLDLALLYISLNVKQMRTAAGLTQDDLAKRCGFHFPRISELERGVAVPTLRTLAILAQALGCSISDLLRAPSA